MSRVWPLLVTHGPVWIKQASLVKLDEQELFETGASLLIKFWSRPLVSFPRPLRLLVRQAGLVTASQLGSERSVVTTQSVSQSAKMNSTEVSSGSHHALTNPFTS